jgi:hypothetical protein
MPNDDERYAELTEMASAAERAQGRHLINEITARVRALQAPAHFHARGMARIRHLPPPPHSARVRWRQALHAWQPRPLVWASVLAASLVLSLTLNAWLGYRTLSLRQQLVERFPALERVATTRDLLTRLDLHNSAAFFNSSLFQSSIQSETSLGALAAAHPALEDQARSLGFAAMSEFYRVGALYAEALAYLRSGNLEVTAKRLTAIEKQLRRLSVPSSLADQVRHMRHLLESGQYTSAVLGEGLALFQPLCEQVAREQGPEQLMLFRVGTWLVDMRLTAAAGDTVLLRQGDKARYFLHEMQRLNAPPKVVEALERLNHLMVQSTMTGADVQEVLRLVKLMQMLLG